MENIYIILKKAYNDNKTLKALALEYKMSRSTLRKKAREIGLDFSKLKTRGNTIDVELLVSKRFGKLIVESYDSRNEKGAIWLCKCDCGNNIKVPTGLLHRSKGSVKSCGCEKHKNKKSNKSPYWKGIGELSSTKWSQIKRNAKKRNIEFNLTIEEAYEVYLEQNKKCKLTGLDISFLISENSNNLASLDRINSKLPYEKTNIQWVCKKINYMKHCMTQEEFIYFCSLVVKNH
jgi:hypothetical protein